MVVNRDYKNRARADVEFSREISLLEEFDRATGMWAEYPANRLTRRAAIDLAPGDGRLFRYR